jgi:hypothetical protein
MSVIPENPDTLLTREQTAAALTAAGYPTKPKTLATKASRGGGPPYRSFGPRAIYRWGDSLAWARERLTEPRHNTSEADSKRATSQSCAARGLDHLDVSSAWPPCLNQQVQSDTDRHHKEDERNAAPGPHTRTNRMP